MIIKGLHKLSLIDYPNKISCIVFCSNCNFRCPYCHNKDLVLDSDNLKIYSTEEILSFLEERKSFLDGVVITGGEPTIYNDLIEFIQKIKEIGYLVKLDTNGSNPELIKEVIDKKLIDYIAMDVKAPLEKYNEVAGVGVDIGKIKQSIEIIKNSGIDYEFRCTVVPRLLGKEDIIEIAKSLVGGKKFILQKFVANNLLDESLGGVRTYSDNELEDIRKECCRFVDTEIR